MHQNSTQTRPLALISTAIPYVNAAPHLGYAFEAVLTDSIARTRRLAGWTVHQQAGTDDNSLKNARSAAALGVSTQELVDANARQFQALREVLALDWDAFVRTSGNPEHRAAVQEIWARCRERGDIYSGSYCGLYCVGCEQFYGEGELERGLCPEHASVPEPIHEPNYFFRLSRYQEQLHDLVASGRLRILPEERKHEVLAFIESGLSDFSISRSRERALNWGLEVPGDGTQVVYVWFDALINYLSGLGRDWPEAWARADRISHIIGKGILRFHAIYWPAILLSAGLRLPSEILVHGYLTVEGRKIGKSLGNAIDPAGICEQFGVDATRYYLLRHVRTTRDGDFSRQRLNQARDSELADQLGNLVQRTTSLIIRYRSGVVPSPVRLGPSETELARRVRQTTSTVEEAVERFQIHAALDAIFVLIAATNRYVDQTAPWALAKHQSIEDRGPKLDSVLYTLADVVRCIGLLLRPFLPDTAREIGERITPGVGPVATGVPGELTPGTRLKKGPPLFPK